MENKLTVEEWEKARREQLKKELSDGAYEIGNDKIKAYTGKGGYIEYIIAIEKAILYKK